MTIRISLATLALLTGITAQALPLRTEFLPKNELVQDSKNNVQYINFGNFDQWITRNIEESSIIGGQTRQVYAIGPTSVINGRTPYLGTGGSPWATSNVMAHVSGIYKTNVSVFKQVRPGHGYCAKLYTHLEQVKVLGIVNIKVLAAGSIYLGQMMEPITSSSNPMKYLNCGIRYSRRPKAIMFDYATKLMPGDRIRQTGFGGAKTIAGRDLADCVVYLQKRWEDAKGNVYAKRIGTMVHYFTQTTNWVNNQEFTIHYGNITTQPFYKSYMGLNSQFYMKNSKGKMVPIKEIEWGTSDDTPTHLIVKFDSSNGGAYTGTVGNTLWVDNVRLVY